MEYNREIEIMRELISNSPSNSELLINGFSNETLSEKSFRKLFDEETVPVRADFAHYNVSLNNKNIKILEDILNEEGDDLIADITHFAIRSKMGFSAISFDGLSSLYINQNHFSSDLIPLRNFRGDDIVIEFQDKLSDNGFFDWK